jgi:glycosyltransferase involved in cell wall biosynthesis
MKILVTAQQWFPDYRGGTARVVQATSVALAKRGHDVHVIVPRHAGDPRMSTVDGVVVHRAIRRSIVPETWTDALETAWHVSQLRRLSPDVILAHHVATATGAVWARTAAPLAFVFHASPFLEARHRRSLGVGRVDAMRSRAVEPALRRLESVALTRADSIFVLSTFSATLVADLHAGAGDRIAKVGGGVDEALFSPAIERAALRLRLGIGPDTRLLVTARRLVPRMGVQTLIEAFARLIDDGKPAKLVIVGDGELRRHLEARSTMLGLDDRVAFVGRVPDATLRDWYRAADLFVLPTLAYEGFGMVTAEALACGTPVVGTPAGATGELLKPLDPALVSDGTDAGSIAEAIRRALSLASPGFRARCRAYAVEQLAWGSVIKRWEASLEKTAGGGYSN